MDVTQDGLVTHVTNSVLSTVTLDPVTDLTDPVLPVSQVTPDLTVTSRVQ